MIVSSGVADEFVSKHWAAVAGTPRIGQRSSRALLQSRTTRRRPRAGMLSAHARSIGATAVRLSLHDRESGKRPPWSARLLGLIPLRGWPRVEPVPAWRQERQPGAHACAQRSGSSLNSERNVLPSAWSASAPAGLAGQLGDAGEHDLPACFSPELAGPAAGGCHAAARAARRVCAGYCPTRHSPLPRWPPGSAMSGTIPTGQALPATAASPTRHRIRQSQARWCQVIWRL